MAVIDKHVIDNLQKELSTGIDMPIDTCTNHW